MASRREERKRRVVAARHVAKSSATDRPDEGAPERDHADRAHDRPKMANSERPRHQDGLQHRYECPTHAPEHDARAEASGTSGPDVTSNAPSDR